MAWQRRPESAASSLTFGLSVLTARATPAMRPAYVCAWEVVSSRPVPACASAWSGWQACAHAHANARVGVRVGVHRQM
eukprot:5439277-Pleurochrysis_carterae.AAC.1